MGHIHSSRNCPGCKEMGMQLKPAANPLATGIGEGHQRLETAGFEHVYSLPGWTQPACQDCAAEQALVLSVSPGPAQPAAQLETLARAVNEQALKLADHISRLESASYRIGYLEALLSAREEKLKLLPDLQSSAAQATANEKRAEELAAKVSGLEEELAKLRSTWWHRLASLFLRQP